MWCIHVAEGDKIDQNGLKMGSKRLFVHAQWSRITFEKRSVFDRSLTHFCCQNGPFSMIFQVFEGPKLVSMGSKWAKNAFLRNSSGICLIMYPPGCRVTGGAWGRL